ncbi:MAG TPA: nucleotidyltransferase domain-containing protein [Ruminiclostridium sp.]
MEKIYSIEQIKQGIKSIADYYGVEKIYIFGSYARGEANSKSDIDLRIDKGKIKGLFALSGFLSDIKECFEVDIDLITNDGLEESFLRQIEGEEILIYESKQ